MSKHQVAEHEVQESPSVQTKVVWHLSQPSMLAASEHVPVQLLSDSLTPKMFLNAPPTVLCSPGAG